jgi:hypothetical protein
MRWRKIKKLRGSSDEVDKNNEGCVVAYVRRGLMRDRVGPYRRYCTVLYK